MKASTRSKKHKRATIERNFLKSVFLNFLNIKKDYYKDYFAISFKAS